MTIYLHPDENARNPGNLNDPSQDDEALSERDLNPPCVLVFNASDPSGAAAWAPTRWPWDRWALTFCRW